MKKFLVTVFLLGSLLPATAQTPRVCPTSETACLFKHISTNTTTTVKSSAGILHSISINTKGATANTVTVYDNTAASGTVLAVIDTTSNTGTLTFDVAFSTGLTVVTASGTAADITVNYN